MFFFFIESTLYFCFFRIRVSRESDENCSVREIYFRIATKRFLSLFFFAFHAIKTLQNLTLPVDRNLKQLVVLRVFRGHCKATERFTVKDCRYKIPDRMEMTKNCNFFIDFITKSGLLVVFGLFRYSFLQKDKWVNRTRSDFRFELEMDRK